MRVLCGEWGWRQREGGSGGGGTREGALLPKKKKKTHPTLSSLFLLLKTKRGTESAKFVKEAEKIQKK